MLHLQNTGAERAGKAVFVRQMWWAGVCSFVFWARAEGPGMSVNRNNFLALQTDSWDMAY